MSDLCERLRALVILDEVGSENPLGREAADKIASLRAQLASARKALEEIQLIADRDSGNYGATIRAGNIAHAALIALSDEKG